MTRKRYIKLMRALNCYYNHSDINYKPGNVRDTPTGGAGIVKPKTATKYLKRGELISYKQAWTFIRAEFGDVKTKDGRTFADVLPEK